jgi:DNA-binding NarL/FixJ family response regulator
MRGEPFLYAGAISALIRDYLMRSRQNDRLPESILTPREEEIVRLIAEGNSSKEIAATLVISIKTVDRHRANILAELGMRDRSTSPATRSARAWSNPDAVRSAPWQPGASSSATAATTPPRRPDACTTGS